MIGRTGALATGLGLGLGLTLALRQAAAAPEASQAEALVQSLVDRGMAILRDPSLKGPPGYEVRHQRLRSIADQSFDWKEMARRSLGPAWRDVDEAQRRRYVTSFADLLANNYLTRLDLFKGDEQVTVGGALPAGDGFEVRTTLVTHGGEQVPLNYFVKRDGSSWRIYDVSIEGVSLTNHYRNTFSRFLVNHPFPELLDKIERKHAALAPPSGRSSPGPGSKPGPAPAPGPGVR